MACSFAALRKDAQALLALINTLPQREWEQRLHKIFVSDDIQGLPAVAWLCQQMMKACPHQSAPFWRSQIDACKRAARVGHKVRCGWEAYGMTPYEVVTHQGYYRHPLLARYNSEPDLLRTRALSVLLVCPRLTRRGGCPGR